MDRAVIDRHIAELRIAAEGEDLVGFARSLRQVLSFIAELVEQNADPAMVTRVSKIVSEIIATRTMPH